MDTATILPPARLWTRAFALVCASTFLCYSSQLLVTPVMALYVEDLGGSPVEAGLVITAFSVTSFFLRPLIGQVTDEWGAPKVLFLGSVVLGVTGLGLLLPALWAVFATSAIRGIGWGAISTAGSTAVALTSTANRRGEASGYYNLAANFASTLAPAAALWLVGRGSFQPAFLAAGAAGLAAAGVSSLMPGWHSGGTGPARWSTSLEGFSPGSFFERGVLLASFLLLAATATIPVTTAFVPLHAVALGVENIGLYFVAAGAVSIGARLVVGRYLDRAPRGVWILSGYSVMIVAFALLARAQSLLDFVLAGAVVAMGHTLAPPILMALAMDRAQPHRMGKAMATYSMFYRAGEAIGAPIAGTLIVWLGYPGMYFGAMASVAAGVLLAAANWGTLGKSRS